MLYEQLAQAARAGVSELQEFQSMWRSPEMKAVWDRVDAQIKENGGVMLQPTGKWERDYDTILADLREEEQAQNEQQQKANEEMERSKIQATEGGWRAIVDGFAQKNVPGVRVLASQSEAAVTVVLVKAGIVFRVEAIAGQDGNGVPDWRVFTRTPGGQTPSKVETAVAQCLNARPRQWDLLYLLVRLALLSTLAESGLCGQNTDFLMLGHDIVLLDYQTDTLRKMCQDDRQHCNPSHHSEAILYSPRTGESNLGGLSSRLCRVKG